MLGAVIGDIAGSTHERRNPPTKTKEFGVLFTKETHFTDDTVCTMAIASWINSDQKLDLSSHLRKFCSRYIHVGYGARFIQWVQNSSMGPYGSWGNGSAMRVSSVGWVATTLAECYNMAYMVSSPTHNHPQAVKGAQVVAGMIFLLRTDRTHFSSKTKIALAIERVLNDLDEDGYYEHVLRKNVNQIRESYSFKVSAKNSVPQTLACLRESNSFEDAIRTAISLGGDADTLAAITGSMAEAVWDIPLQLKAECIGKLNSEFRKIFSDFHQVN